MGKGKDNFGGQLDNDFPENKDPKGWSDIQEGEHLTKLANMVVLDRLKKLDKDNGTTDHANHWNNLKGTDNMAFALQLKVDRDASFMSVTESHAQTNTTKNTMLKVWLTEAQVAAQ